MCIFSRAGPIQCGSCSRAQAIVNVAHASEERVRHGRLTLSPEESKIISLNQKILMRYNIELSCRPARSHVLTVLLNVTDSYQRRSGGQLQRLVRARFRQFDRYPLPSASSLGFCANTPTSVRYAVQNRVRDKGLNPAALTSLTNSVASIGTSSV